MLILLQQTPEEDNLLFFVVCFLLLHDIKRFDKRTILLHWTCQFLTIKLYKTINKFQLVNRTLDFSFERALSRISRMTIADKSDNSEIIVFEARKPEASFLN
eukprot:TRINITY_DN433_c0_g2_i1.p2 TRINITY_DN433_c0_g2~~TRINITY_DN433_c0_g2_i1.p2  ORF type:complete len:102 (-),score=18.10 TRINITY_DN433_c0_g2_i1:720-1025(-)